MRNIAIIPARGGSKRIPRKNIKPFLGKPIIAYSIEAAIKSGLFDEVMVSTDDEEIANIARSFGANVPFLRSVLTSNDFAGISEVIEEVVTVYEQRGRRFDNWCCILPTAPFVSSHLLINSFQAFIKGKFDTLRPIVRFSYPIQRAFVLSTNLKVKFLHPQYQNTRTQDLTPTFHDAGLFYWGTTTIGFKGRNWGGYVIKESVCQDIDTIDDWEIAEIKYNIINKYDLF